ncbi:MAG: nitric oxide reductase activation protein NorD [Thermoproteota archaeon]
MTEEYRKQLRKLTNLSPEKIERFVSEIFSEKSTEENRNIILYTAMGVADRSTANQLLESSLTILRNFPDFLKSWCRIGIEIAVTSVAAAEEYFRSSPEVLREISKEELCSWASLGKLIAERSGEAAVEYFKISPKLLRTISLNELLRWGNEGYRILIEGGKSNEVAAVEYFATRTRSSFEHMTVGKAALLEEYGRTLKLYGEAICAKEVNVQQVSDSFWTDGRTIYLPSNLNAYEEKELNFRLYRALTALLVGRIAYGSFDLDLSKICNDVSRIAARYGSKPDLMTKGVEAFFRLYPNPLLAKEIFDMLDDIRVERILRRNFRGIKKDLDLLRNTLIRDSKLEGMEPVQTILQILKETLFLGRMPMDVPMWAQCWIDLCMQICQEVGDLVESTALATDHIYIILERVQSYSNFKEKNEKHRVKDGSQNVADLFLGRSGVAWRHPKMQGSMKILPKGRRRGVTIFRGQLMDIIKKIKKRAIKSRAFKFIQPRSIEEAVFKYDEWDYKIGDYRRRWCSVRERSIGAASARFAEKTIAVHSTLISAVRREFQMFKPEKLKKEKKQTDGEEVDIDALVESFSEIKAGAPSIEYRVYTHRNKVQRDISVAFLVDMSGSTAGWVIDTEKKALLVMCEALEAIGDNYAIYGFSGATREDVEFYVLKEFDMKYGHEVKCRIGRMTSLSQNRDGAAIRHTIHKLEQTESKTKLLIVLSDGHPLDMIPRPGEPLYEGEYSVQDTRMALKEAKIRGIRPFCITVDTKATDYISKMYADVNYTIIDNLSKLPERMPTIYRRLTT